MLLHGVDLPGLERHDDGGASEDDVAHLTAAVGGALDVLREEGLM